MSLNTGIFTDSLGEFNEKIRQCKLVMTGKQSPPHDFEEQSSTLLKSKATFKLEWNRSRLVRAKCHTLALLKDSFLDNEETEDPNLVDVKKTCRVSSNRKVPHSTISLVGGTKEEDLNAV